MLRRSCQDRTGLGRKGDTAGSERHSQVSPRRQKTPRQGPKLCPCLQRLLVWDLYSQSAPGIWNVQTMALWGSWGARFAEKSVMPRREEWCQRVPGWSPAAGHGGTSVFLHWPSEDSPWDPKWWKRQHVLDWGPASEDTHCTKSSNSKGCTACHHHHSISGQREDEEGKSKKQKTKPPKTNKKIKCKVRLPSLRLSRKGLATNHHGGSSSLPTPALPLPLIPKSLSHPQAHASEPFTLFPRVQTLALLGKICAEHCGYWHANEERNQACPTLLQRTWIFYGLYVLFDVFIVSSINDMHSDSDNQKFLSFFSFPEADLLYLKTKQNKNKGEANNTKTKKIHRNKLRIL